MKKISRFLAILAIAVIAVSETSAQCVPDADSCIDTGDPGQICPQSLPEVTVNVFYDEVITVIAPDSAGIGDIFIGLDHIVVDSVKNLPPGIDYYTNATKFFPDSIYCIQITGTPALAGDYPLEIYVSVFADLGTGSPIKVAQIVDDTSVVMTVHETSSIDPFKLHDFQVLPNAPNPFSHETRFGFFTPLDDRIELEVYNILGKLMHQEKQEAPPGEHYFQFNGSDLQPGTYFYRITNSKRFYTGKFIKSN